MLKAQVYLKEWNELMDAFDLKDKLIKVKLTIPYVSYSSLIKPEICKKIIDLGISKIEKNKLDGIDNFAQTLNDKQKKINLERSKVLKNYSQSDKTLEELKDPKLDLDKYFIRDSEISH